MYTAILRNAYAAAHQQKKRAAPGVDAARFGNESPCGHFFEAAFGWAASFAPPLAFGSTSVTAACPSPPAST